MTPKLFAELGERIHEAVLVHRDVILYANRQFAALVGADRVDLAGSPRWATSWHPSTPSWCTRTSAGGCPESRPRSATRSRSSGREGQVSRLEITSSRVDYEGGSALLVTGVEILRRRPSRRCASRGTATPVVSAGPELADRGRDRHGRRGPDHLLNPAAERLTGDAADRRPARPWKRSSAWSMRPIGACCPTRCARRSRAARP